MNNGRHARICRFWQRYLEGSGNGGRRPRASPLPHQRAVAPRWRRALISSGELLLLPTWISLVPVPGSGYIRKCSPRIETAGALQTARMPESQSRHPNRVSIRLPADKRRTGDSNSTARWSWARAPRLGVKTCSHAMDVKNASIEAALTQGTCRTGAATGLASDPVPPGKRPNEQTESRTP